MITLRRAKPVAELTAPPETDELFHEIKQTFRITGIPLNFRIYAGQGRFLQRLWEAARPNAETRAFEEGADRLREEIVSAADGMPRLCALAKAQLGESQAHQAQAALALHLYMNPKLLLFESALALALEREGRPREWQSAGSAETIERGAPARMAALELADERAAEPELRRLFREIRRMYGPGQLDGDWLSLALWPRYLSAAWERLKPAARTEGYRRSCERLVSLSRALARGLPYPMALSKDELAREGAPSESIERETLDFERRLAPLCLNMALLSLDWRAPELLRRSPFPAGSRAGARARQGG